MSDQSQDASLQNVDESVLIYNTLEDRANKALSTFTELDDGHIKLEKNAKCDSQWKELLHCYEVTGRGQNSASSGEQRLNTSKDDVLTHEKIMQSCAGTIEKFLECAQNERVSFMRRLAKQIDLAQESADPNVKNS